jgi:site-specific DNA recombinase
MEEFPQKTGIIYARVSSWEQVSNTSLERQIRECRDHAERLNIKIITEPFVEEGESAKTADRTEFQRAIKFCATKRPRVDYFIVHKIDRFARNQADHVTTQVILRKLGTTLVSASEPIDQSVMGRAMEGMLSVWAELDNNMRAERSKSGMVEKAKRGIWVWKPPLGYKRLGKGGNLVVDESVGPYIELLFEEYAKGTYSYQALSDYLGDRGFRSRTGKKPCAQLIEKIVRNPVYYGIIRAWGLESKGMFPAIISEELFWKCQVGVKNKFGPNKKGVSNNPLFPLRKFAVCPNCGISLTGSVSTGRKGIKYPYYHHQKQDCASASFIPKETLEQNFIEFLQQISPRKRNEKIFKAVVMDVWQKNFKKLDTDNTRARAEIANLEVERQRIFDMHRSGKYTDAEFLEQKGIVSIQIQEKKTLLEEKRIEEFSMDEALEHCFNFIRASGQTWKSLEKNPSLRARFQKSAFPEKVTFDGKKFGTKKMSLVYELNQNPHAKKSHFVTQVGRNWNQLIPELNSWLVFGRQIESVTGINT